jgi:hypothetical protein
MDTTMDDLASVDESIMSIRDLSIQEEDSLFSNPIREAVGIPRKKPASSSKKKTKG